MDDYAYFLKDVYGINSYYRRYRDEVAYMPPKRCPSDNDVFRRTKIDVNSMEVLDSEFIKDKDKVYRMGYLLKGIDPSDFHTFNCIYTGNHQVIYTPFGDAEVAHPESFETLDEGGFTRSGLKFPDGILLAHGGKYENRYFCHSYGRDEEFVYYFTEITQTRKAVRLKACHDPKTFEVLHMGYMTALARDDKHVYCYDHTVKKADPKTARHIGEHYWCDKRYVFFNERIVEGADVSSFKIVLPGKQWSTAVAADKNHYYQYCDILSDEEYQEAARKSSM